MDLAAIKDTSERLRVLIHRLVVGQDEAIDMLIVALLSQGHVLMEGVPGTAKTLIARTFAAGLSLAFNRIQFTPDLMPGDVLGTNLFDFQRNEFQLTKGPIFTDLLLADEINRTPPKTQAALLQAMQERSVTIDGKTHELGSAFMVIATQNPLEQEGTYPLPEAQLDRFLFKIVIEYPTRDEEKEIVRMHGHRTGMPQIEDFQLSPVADREVLRRMQEAVIQVRLSDEIVDYVVNLVRATREHPSLRYGASPRSATMIATAARACAFLQGRDFVIPDDVKRLASPSLGHRVLLSAGAEIQGLSSYAVLDQILTSVAAPR